MNIQSVARSLTSMNIAHQSDYLYGLDRNLLPPKSLPNHERVALDGAGHVDTIYQFRRIEGWLGDVPVSFTYLMAYRSYEQTKLVFSKTDWNTALTSTNSWLV